MGIIAEIKVMADNVQKKFQGTINIFNIFNIKDIGIIAKKI